MRPIKLLVWAALSASLGCAAVPRQEPAPAAREKKIVGWRLTERPYGEIDDPWASAGDGLIPGGETVMVYEPVYRKEEVLVRDLVTARTACLHSARAEYDGPSSANVGDPVTVTLWVDGPRDVAHVVEFAGSHAHVEILEVSGAPPLAGEPGRYFLGPGARARVTFTARAEGRGGLRISVESEVIDAGGRHPPAMK